MAFNNFPTDMTPYSGGNDKLQDEKRMANWQRSYSLPSMLGDAVQSAMMNNPDDRNAALRMQLAQASANSTNLPWRTKEALANHLFGNTVANAGTDAVSDPSSATSTPGMNQGPMAAASHRSPQAATQSDGPASVSGNFQGHDIMVPTAGNYMNGAYQRQNSALGLGDSPTVAAYQQAVQNFKTPEQRQAIEINNANNAERLREAYLRAHSTVQAAGLRGGGKAGGPRQAVDAKQLGVANGVTGQAWKELGSHYAGYLANHEKAMDGTPALTQEQWMAKDPRAMSIIESLGVNPKAQAAYPDAFQSVVADNTGERHVGLSVQNTGGQALGGQAIPPQHRAMLQQGIQQAKANGASSEQVLGMVAADQQMSPVEKHEAAAIIKTLYEPPATPQRNGPQGDAANNAHAGDLSGYIGQSNAAHDAPPETPASTQARNANGRTNQIGEMGRSGQAKGPNGTARTMDYQPPSSGQAKGPNGTFRDTRFDPQGYSSLRGPHDPVPGRWSEPYREPTYEEAAKMYADGLAKSRASEAMRHPGHQVNGQSLMEYLLHLPLKPQDGPPPLPGQAYQEQYPNTRGDAYKALQDARWNGVGL